MPSTSDNTCSSDLGTDYIVGGGWSDNVGIMFCETISSIFIWLIAFATLCLTGMTFMGCGSCGNADSTQRIWAPLWAFLFVVLTIAIPGNTNNDEETEDLKVGASSSGPYQITDNDELLSSSTTSVMNITTVNNDSSNSSGDEDNETGLLYLKVVASLLGIIAAFMHLLHLVYLLSPNGSSVKEKLGRHAMQDEIDLKTAQGYKLTQMVKNACTIHKRKSQSSVLRTCFGHGIYEYSKSVERDVEKTGGFWWGWKLIWSKDAFRYVFLFVCLCVCFLLIIFCVQSTYTSIHSYDALWLTGKKVYGSLPD
jgi:hypothetical protein